MKKWISVATLLLFCGCKSEPSPPPPPPPAPSIRVERQEDTNGVKLVIWFDHHHQDSYGNGLYGDPYVSFTMQDEEQIREYKKQLEFALSQIEEVEKRMSVHEPEQQP